MIKMFNKKVDDLGEMWTIDENSGCFEVAVKIIVIVLLTLVTGAGMIWLYFFLAVSSFPVALKGVLLILCGVFLTGIWAYYTIKVVRA